MTLCALLKRLLAYLGSKRMSTTYRVARDGYKEHGRIDNMGYKDGLFELYYPEERGGRILQRGYYIKGKKNGLWEEWNKNGKKACACTYKEDELHGLYERYWASGGISLRTYYKDGEICGPYEFYHANGQIALYQGELGSSCKRYGENGVEVKRW